MSHILYRIFYTTAQNLGIPFNCNDMRKEGEKERERRGWGGYIRSLIPFLVSCRALLCRVFVCDVCCTSLAKRSHYGRVLQCMQSVTSVFPESLPGPELLICLVPCATCSVLRNTLDVHVGSLRFEGLVIILRFEGLLAQNGLGASLFLVLVLVGSADTLLTLPGRRNAYEWCAVIG